MACTKLQEVQAKAFGVEEMTRKPVFSKPAYAYKHTDKNRVCNVCGGPVSKCNRKGTCLACLEMAAWEAEQAAIAEGRTEKCKQCKGRFLKAEMKNNSHCFACAAKQAERTANWRKRKGNNYEANS